MKRPLSLSATILGLISNSLFMALIIYFFFKVEFLAGYNYAVYTFLGTLLFVQILCLISCVLLLVKYKIAAPKKDSIKVLAIVFLFANIAGAIIMAVSRWGILALIASIIETVCCLSSIVLLIIDLSMENQSKATEIILETEEKVNIQQNNFFDKIAKLNELKQNGFITEEEFASLKSSVIEENALQRIQKPKSAFQLKIERLDNMRERGLINETEYKALKINYINEMVVKK